MPYQDPADFGLLPEMVRLAPPEAEAFLVFDKAIGRSDGAIPPRYRELIALGVALTTQCAYCLDVHTGRALEAGATREELAETAFIAASPSGRGSACPRADDAAAGRAGGTGRPVSSRVATSKKHVAGPHQPPFRLPSKQLDNLYSVDFAPP